MAETYLNESTKLDGGNYANWKFKVLTVLEGHNLYLIASGVEPKPTTATTILDWEKGKQKQRCCYECQLRTTSFLMLGIVKHPKKHGLFSKSCMKHLILIIFYS